MTETDAPPAREIASKGLAMVAAYRTQRLSQRAALHEAHRARKLQRESRQPRVAARAAATSADPAEEPSASVFAGLVTASLATAEAAIPDPAPAREPPPAQTAEPAPPAYDPPLAEIGLGPGMLIRLSQLGLHTTGELAQADAAQLRAALGDISRLVDVETWISNARQSRTHEPKSK